MFSDFVSGMLEVDPRERAEASALMEHEWLRPKEEGEQFKVSEYEYQLQKKKKQLMLQADSKNGSILNYRDSESEQADGEDNDEDQEEEREEGSEQSLDPMTAERSFLNCGYLGYKNGIKVEELDNTKNWQFS